MNILTVDDNQVTALLVEDIIAGLGHTPLVAHSKAEAVAMVRAQAIGVSVVDWELPDGTGLEVVRAIRSASPSPHAYILMLTSRDAQMDEVRAIEAGIDQYLTKPVSPKLLRSSIAHAIRRASVRNAG